MKKTLSYLKYTKKEAILGPFFKMLEVCFELLVPVVVSKIVDVGIKNQDIPYILICCFILLGFAILGFVSSVTAQYFSAKAAVYLATNIQKDLFMKVQSLQYGELDDIGTATLITRMSSDVNQIQIGMNMALRLLLRSPVVVIGAVIVAFTFDFKAGIIFLCTVPALFLIIFGILLVTVPLYKKSQEQLDQVTRYSRENLTGVRVIRAFNQQINETEKFETSTKKLTKAQLFVGRVATLTNPLTYALINLFIILLVYIGAIRVNEGALTQGGVLALYSLSTQILVEMIKFANLIITISKAVASSSRVETVLNMKSELKKTVQEEIENESFLKFQNVSMAYPGSNKDAVENISFTIQKGQTIGIIGGTGSGKSTLAALINHFYDIRDGKIYYKGKELTSYSLDELHQNIAVVPQKAQLFKGTIASNLKWGNENATEEEMLVALKAAQGEDILFKKEKGLNEEVEQGGRNFSGGQKQRLCIARALLKESEILILDDSSSALDYATDAALRTSLKNWKEELTTIIISQRTSSIQHCDQILVMDNGRLVGIGTHEKLLKSCSVYQEIYESQFKKESKDE